MGRIDILSQVLDILATTFGGKRNLPEVLGYRPVLTYNDYLARFARTDIAGRIVEIPAEATWSELPRLTGDLELQSETALSKKFATLAKRIKLRRMLQKADVLAGIGRYSVVLIGFNDNKKLEEPVEEGSLGPDDVLFVQPFSEDNAQPADIDINPNSPGFGRPSHYTIDLSRGLTATDPTLKSIVTRMADRWRSSLTGQRVHVSRIVHLADGTLEDDLYGTPRLRRVWDRMDDLAKIAGGASEVFWMVANRGLQFDIDKDLSLSPEDEADLEQQIDDYKHGQSREFKTRGMTIKGLNELGAGNVNPRQVFTVIAGLIVGATGIPYRKLFGTERGQNINAQDQAEWLERVAARREAFGNEVVLGPLIERLVWAGALPSAALDAQLVWPVVHDDMHQAEVADVVARACVNHTKSLAGGGGAVSVSEFRSLYLALPKTKPVDDAAVLPAPPPAPVVAAPGDTQPADKPKEQPRAAA